MRRKQSLDWRALALLGALLALLIEWRMIYAMPAVLMTSRPSREDSTTTTISWSSFEQSSTMAIETEQDLFIHLKAYQGRESDETITDRAELVDRHNCNESNFGTNNDNECNKNINNDYTFDNKSHDESNRNNSFSAENLKNSSYLNVIESNIERSNSLGNMFSDKTNNSNGNNASDNFHHMLAETSGEQERHISRRLKSDPVHIKLKRKKMLEQRANSDAVLVTENILNKNHHDYSYDYNDDDRDSNNSNNNNNGYENSISFNSPPNAVSARSLFDTVLDSSTTTTTITPADLSQEAVTDNDISPLLESENSTQLAAVAATTLHTIARPTSSFASTISSTNIAILSRTERSIRNIDASNVKRNRYSGGIVRRSSSSSSSSSASAAATDHNSSSNHNGSLKTKRLNNSRNASFNSNSHNSHNNNYNNNNNNRNNLDRNERSAISLLSGPTRKIQLYIKNRFIQLLPDGTINGTQDDQSEYTILQRSTVDVGRIKIQSVATCLYLCMDQCGSVYGSKEFTDDCVFNENMEQHNYNTYSSTYNSNVRRIYYLALNRHGEPRKLQIPASRSLGKLATYTNAITEPVPQERVEQLIAKNFGANRIKHGLRQLCDTGKPLIELIDSRNFRARPQCSANGGVSGSGSSTSSSSSSSGSSSIRSSSSIGSSSDSSSGNTGSSSNSSISSSKNSSSGQLLNNVPSANDRTRVSNANANRSSHSEDSSSGSSRSSSSNNGHTSNSNSNSNSISSSSGSSGNSRNTASGNSNNLKKKKKKKRRKCRPHENEEEHNCQLGPHALRKRLQNNNKNQNTKKCHNQQQKQQPSADNATVAAAPPVACAPKRPKKNANKKKNDINGAGVRQHNNNNNAKNNKNNADGELPNNRRGKKKPGHGRQGGNANGGGKKNSGGGGNGGGVANKKRGDPKSGPKRLNGKQKKAPISKTTTSRTTTAAKTTSTRLLTTTTTLLTLLQLETSTVLPDSTSSLYDSLALFGQTTSDRGEREQRNVHYSNSMENAAGAADADADEDNDSESAENLSAQDNGDDDGDDDDDNNDEDDNDAVDNQRSPKSNNGDNSIEAEQEDDAEEDANESYEDEAALPVPTGDSSTQLTGGAEDFLYYDQLDL